MNFLLWLRDKFLSISLKEIEFERRGFFRSEAKVQNRLELIGGTFLRGYHASLHDENLDHMGFQLNLVEKELQGFAFEGAAMGLALLDALTPWQKNRLQLFLQGAGSDHAYMVHIGAGWVLARLPQNYEKVLAQFDDSLLGWLAIDGYGFHQGYFHWRRYIQKQVAPRNLSGYSCRVFDQGLGRSLWFVEGGDVSRIPVTISTFPQQRQADLWSGVGLACAYAGGVDRRSIEALRAAAQSYQPQLAQGAAFAAKARQRAGNLATHTELACEILCFLTADAAAAVTDSALQQLPSESIEPAYEIWRQRIQSEFAAKEVNV